MPSVPPTHPTMSQFHAPVVPGRRILWAVALAAVAAACGKKSDSSAGDPRAADSANAAAAGAPPPTTTSTPGDSTTPSIVTQSAPPTAGDRSVAGRDSAGRAGTTGANRSGMPTTGETVPKKKAP